MLVIDLKTELGSGLHLPVTEKAYNYWLRKFAEGLQIDWDQTQRIPKEHFTDSNVAKFFVHLGQTSHYTPHTIKGARAAISSMLKIHGLTPIHDKSNEWALTIQALMVSSPPK